MIRLFGIVGALYGLLAVAVGAFAAHALSGRLDQRALDWIDTASRYQFFHALALVAIVALSRSAEPSPASASLRLAGACFAVGVAVFSGTLYAMAAGGPRWLGAVTPVGGILMLAGWGALAVAVWRLPG